MIEPYYYKNHLGRRPRGIETMFRMYLLATWFNLADEAVEDAIYDSYAMRKFMRLDFTQESVPDATTLCKFRKLLNEHHLHKAHGHVILHQVSGLVPDGEPIGQGPMQHHVPHGGVHQGSKQHKRGEKPEAKTGCFRVTSDG